MKKRHGPIITEYETIISKNQYEYGRFQKYSSTYNPFIPLQKNSFNTIKIDIRDDLGKPIPFEHGKLYVTLNFKKIEGKFSELGLQPPLKIRTCYPMYFDVLITNPLKKIVAPL